MSDMKSPRSYGQSHHDHEPVDLNSAPVDKIASLPMVGQKRAEEIINHRPFTSFEDLKKKVPSISDSMIDDLKSGNAKIG